MVLHVCTVDVTIVLQFVLLDGLITHMIINYCTDAVKHTSTIQSNFHYFE